MLRLQHDTQIALLPRKIAFIPVSREANDTTATLATENERGERFYFHPKNGKVEGSVDVFAAIGMAMETKKDALVVIDTSCLPATFFDDLSTEEGRKKCGLNRESNEGFRAGVRQTLWLKVPENQDTATSTATVVMANVTGTASATATGTDNDTASSAADVASDTAYGIADSDTAASAGPATATANGADNDTASSASDIVTVITANGTADYNTAAIAGPVTDTANGADNDTAATATGIVTDTANVTADKDDAVIVTGPANAAAASSAYCDTSSTVVGSCNDAGTFIRTVTTPGTTTIPVMANTPEPERRTVELHETHAEVSVDEESPLFKATRGLIFMDKIEWVGDCKPSVQCEKPKSETEDPPMLANSVRGSMTVESFGAVAEVARQVQDQNDTMGNLRYGEKTCTCLCPCSCNGSEPISVDKSKFKDWGDELKGFDIIAVSDVSVQTCPESEQPTNDSMRNFFKKYRAEESKQASGTPMDIMNAEEKDVVATVKAGKNAYIWVHFGPGFMLPWVGNERKASDEADFRLCRVWWNASTSRMCWAALSHKEFNQCCILPSWMRRNANEIILDNLPTEKEANFSNHMLNSDDFTEKRFNEELLWFIALTDNKSKLSFPPDAHTCANTVVGALEQISRISEILGKHFV